MSFSNLSEIQSVESKLPGLNSLLKCSAFATYRMSQDIEAKNHKTVGNIRKYYFSMNNILQISSGLGV